MKKKLVLILAIISVLCVLFALSVSATRVEDYDDTYTLVNASTITHYERHYYNETQYHRRAYTDSITVSFIDENGDPVVEVPMWEYDEGEGRYYSLVWYIAEYTFEKETATTVISEVEYTYDKYTSAVYTLKCVRALDIRYDFTYSEKWSFSTTSVGYEYSYKVKKPLWGMFLDVNNTPDNKDDDYILQASRGMGRDTDDYGYIGWDEQFTAQGNKIVVANLRDCDFDADCTGNYGTKTTWYLATNLQCLWYPDTLKLLCGGTNGYEIDLGDGVEAITCQVIRDNKKVKEFVIPNSCIFLENESFRGTDLTKLTIGENLIVCPGSNAFLYTGGADNLVLSKNLLDKLTTSITSFIANKSATIYFDGNLADAEALMAKIKAADSTYSVTLVDYKTTQERGDVKNVCLFYNYNRCEAFYRGQHVIGVVKEFANGPLAMGTCVEGCTREGCDNSTKTNIPAVFVNPGFSVPEVGDKKVVLQTIAVNYDSLELYNSLYDDKIVGYGVLAGTQKKLGDVTDIFDNTGAVVVDGAAVAKISERSEKYDVFQMKVAGLEGGDEANGAYADLALYCCGYYLTSDGATTDSYYVSEGVVTEVLPDAVSYNTIVASKNESEE